MTIAEPPDHRACTKIVATVGPACCDPKTLASLVEAGVDVFRLNTAHGTRDEHEETFGNIRRVARETGRPVGILIDLAGPKIRLGPLLDDPTECHRDAEFRFIRGEVPGAADELVSTYDRLIDELAVGDSVMLADGTVAMTVVEKGGEKGGDWARCRVVGAGTIRGRQGINLPGVKLSVPALTERDRDNAVWAARAGADFISLSFIRSATEMRQLDQLVRSHDSAALVIAKIEKPEALENLQEIVGASGGIMVARGDLGVEIDVAEMPMAQKQIIETCRRLCKPVIVATQMLDSMHRSRRPTRAEATDVANAILDGADACMLSGETAIGDFPIEAVDMMNRIMLATERPSRESPEMRQWVADPPCCDVVHDSTADVNPTVAATLHGATDIARDIDARLVVVATHSGHTALVRAKQHDSIPTVGVTDSDATLRQMSLYWGVTPLAAPKTNPAELRRFIDDWGLADGSLSAGDRVVLVTGSDLEDGVETMVVVHQTRTCE